MAAVGPAVWLLVLALGSTPRGGSGTDQVPLLAWSTEASLFGSQAAPSEGHVLSGLQMAAYLNPALAKGPKTIVLFLQDKLSVDDFTAYGGVYGNRQDSAFPSLQAALDSSASSLVLPAVDWRAATTLLPTLQVAVGAGPLYVDQMTIRELRLNASVPSLLVVNLPYTSSSILIRPKEALTANDNIVGKVLEVLKREGVPFTAVLTGSRPSRVSVGDVDQWGMSSRRLLEVGSEAGAAGTPHPPLAYNESGRPCILLWASSLGLSRTGTPLTDLTNLTFSPQPSVTLAGSTCSNHSAQLVLSYNNVEKLGDVKITFRMTSRWYSMSARSWFTLDQVEIQVGTDLTAFNVTEVYAPSVFSFSCYSLSDQPRSGALLRPSAASSPTAWSLHLTNFQIQAFEVKGVSFSYASDCASFFTPAIWMGLLTSLLMLFILTYGLHMVTSLKTMDRFDDPKGPTISVPQTE